jgi:hypothetical protein
LAEPDRWAVSNDLRIFAIQDFAVGALVILVAGFLVGKIQLSPFDETAAGVLGAVLAGWFWMS